MAGKPKPPPAKPLPPVRYPFRPSLTFRIGSWLYEKLKGRG